MLSDDGCTKRTVRLRYGVLWLAALSAGTGERTSDGGRYKDWLCLLLFFAGGSLDSARVWVCASWGYLQSRVRKAVLGRRMRMTREPAMQRDAAPYVLPCLVRR